MRNIEKTLSLLGMTRRAGMLIIGQDSVKSRLSRGDELFLMFPDDAPYRSRKTFLSFTKNTHNYTVLEGISTDQLARAIGVGNVVVVALPEQSGFVSGIKSNLNFSDSIEGSATIEQSENIRTCKNIRIKQQGDDENSH
jgi:hypothetical protein